MRVMEFLIRVIVSPFFAVGQLIGAVLWFFVGWFRFIAHGGEFVWYKNVNDRKTISDLFDQLEDLSNNDIV